jgi:hypothetical protein
MVPMLQIKSPVLPALLGLGLFGFAISSLSTPADAAASTAGPRMYEVTITNLSSNQIISPPILLTHDGTASLFTPGAAASPELAALAEDGDNSGLATMMMGNPGVLDVVTAPGGIPPMTSMTLTIDADFAHRWFSMAGMFVTTNDAFVSVQSITVDEMARSGKFFVPVWDAGSEANSEDGMYIPGPPFGNGGAHDPAPSEGFVHLHSGIHGIKDVLPETYDWGSAGAMIEFTRL